MNPFTPLRVGTNCEDRVGSYVSVMSDSNRRSHKLTAGSTVRERKLIGNVASCKAREKSSHF